MTTSAQDNKPKAASLAEIREQMIQDISEICRELELERLCSVFDFAIRMM